jgi:hypothetical protein
MSNQVILSVEGFEATFIGAFEDTGTNVFCFDVSE